MKNNIKNRFVSLNGERPVPNSTISKIEERLTVILPSDFKEIVSYFDGSGIYSLALHSISVDEPKTNIVSETLRLREAIGIPTQFVVLGEPPESLIVMDCSQKGKVTWCDANDVYRLGKEALLSKPDEWPTFTAFFEHVLDDEEEDRKQ